MSFRRQSRRKQTEKKKQQNKFAESPESIDGEPPSKIAKASRQLTITEFASTSQNTNSETAPQLYSAARARKVKIHSEQEIQNASEMVKLYRVFWNNKAEEICSSQALKQFLPGQIQGAINVAWTIEKAKYIKREAAEVEQEVGPGCPEHLVKKFADSKKTIERNTKCMEAAHNSVKQFQEKLSSARYELFQANYKTERGKATVKIDTLEKKLEGALSELRKSEDSLWKAIDNKKKLISALKDIRD